MSEKVKCQIGDLVRFEWNPPSQGFPYHGLHATVLKLIKQGDGGFPVVWQVRLEEGNKNVEVGSIEVMYDVNMIPIRISHETNDW